MAIRRPVGGNRPLKIKAGPLKVSGPFTGTMQSGPARPVRGHGLSDEHQARGLLYVEKAIWEDAIREFQKSVELTPEFSEGWNNLGLCFLYTDRIDDAIEALNQAIKYFPGWPMALSNLGLAFQKSKKLDQAINYYRQSVNKQRSQPQVWATLGEVLETTGKPDEALEAYRAAISLQPKYDQALYRLGMMLARRNEYDEAEKYLKTALEQDPSLADVAAVLGAIASRRGHLDVARTYWEQAKNSRPDALPSGAARGLAALDFYEQRLEQNFQELQSQYNDLPSLAECLFNAGLVYVKDGKLGAAETAFQDSSAGDPNWVEPLIWLGMVKALDKRPKEAREQWEVALKMANDNSMLYETIGAICLAFGLSKEAERNFEEARKLGRQVTPPAITAARAS